MKTTTGHGEETHQQGGTTLTTNHGIPVSDNQNSLKASPRGPALLEDFMLREKIFHFDHERIPERIVHARGSGAHGEFECTDPLTDLCKADLFSKAGKKTEVFARFSTVAGGAGSVDTPRDVRGFAVKFYTEQGNWDLVGNNIPVFFIQDAIKFPDLIHSVKMEADRAYPQAGSAHDTFWDFASLMPETTHMLLWAMSDRTLPRSLRMMEGFGVNTFRLVNAKGAWVFVKFHWRPVLGIQSTVWDEALALQAADNDFHRRDLFEAIAKGDFPQWELYVQTLDAAAAEKLPYDILDATKLIPEETAPLRKVGVMTLNRNPDNFFAETEQVAFLPSNVVPGVEFSDDPLLQGRLFSYLDTQKSRLGTTNFHQIPINAPRCPFQNMNRDGLMQTLVPKGRSNYEPNSLAEPGPRETPKGFVTERHFDTDDAGKQRVRGELFADHYSQAELFWKSQTDIERAHIASAFVFELSKVNLDPVPPRLIANLRNVDEELARRVAEGLGLDLPAASKPAREKVKIDRSPALGIVAKMKPTLKGRKIGVLIAEGSDAKALAMLRKTAAKEGATLFVVAPRAHNVKLSDGEAVKADGQLLGSPSPLFDAVAVILSETQAKLLSREGAAVKWVMDAFAHLKAIGAEPEAQPLLDRAGVEMDEGVCGLDATFFEAAKTRQWAREPKLRMLA
jgi:catalase